ncbi:hypothetical protein BO70DRAFT_41466 [Aspergillus heteromorphus CBS 117.55]|uniref:Uncharacterized protein n=1 Tax=Aspergillus heteromorphus CBS 117.55 TaxID=1448321 RepID=A0A317W5D9_9EURO|nr:uncharacterized protein BO70DRAFT_41466 [Aspergillus heteromorphus CBS 117.55]PWY81876.1 hypothetical protein BO70DRAFT_41466 [Aspergillus heteromorphus CBS 117.55]
MSRLHTISSLFLFDSLLFLLLLQSWGDSKISGVRACFTGQDFLLLTLASVGRAEVPFATIECLSGFLLLPNTAVLFTLAVSMFKYEWNQKKKTRKG